jgi:starch synthase (maltosyl-transferring)
VLAATLSGNYGMYNGFELLEHEPIPGKEEYLNSEKYELKVRDWNRTSNLRFAQVDDSEVIGFVKEPVGGDNAAAVAVALANTGPGEFWFHFGDIEVGLPSSRRRVKFIENLITGEGRLLEWDGVRLRIDPQAPALLFRCFT